MKFLIVFACALAAASANLAHVAPVYGAPQHLPVIGANGVPVDTAEVQHAKAAHFAHKVEAHARNGDYAVAAYATPAVAAYSAYATPAAYSAYSAPAVAAAYGAYGAYGYGAYPYSAYGYSAYAAPAAYPTTAVLPASVNGVPLETPEVVAAKSKHFAAHAEALARNVHAVHYRKRRGVYTSAPVAYSTGYTSPLAYSTGYSAPLVSAYSAAPVVASTYSHAPFVASTYGAHSYASPLAYY